MELAQIGRDLHKSKANLIPKVGQTIQVFVTSTPFDCNAISMNLYIFIFYCYFILIYLHILVSTS